MTGAPSRSPRIERPPAESGRTRAVRATAVGLATFALGLTAAIANADGVRVGARHDPAPPRVSDGRLPESNEGAADAPDAPAKTAPTAATQTPDDAPQPVPEPAFVVAEGDAGAAPAETDDTASDEGVPTATPFAGPRRVERGRVAYLRCDGVPLRPGPYPCPREERLEEAVWAVLETLPRCAEAPAGLGETDVRLELARDAPPEVKLRAPRADVPRLDGAAVLRCVAGPLSHVTTSSRATRLMLAFRVTLVDAAQPR